MASWQDIHIETERLVLRPPQAGDFEPWAALLADARSARFLGGPYPREVAWRRFLEKTGAWVVQGYSVFSVIEKSSGRWIGRLGPWVPEGWPGSEIGWALLPDAWGHGYATEGAKATIDYAFDVLGWERVIHTIDDANSASQHVARRLGSIPGDVVRMPPPLDVSLRVWGQTRAEWRQSRKRGNL